MGRHLFRLGMACLMMTAGLFVFSQLIFLLGLQLSPWHFFVMPILSLLAYKGANRLDPNPMGWGRFVGGLVFFWAVLIGLAYATKDPWAWATCDRGVQTEILLALMEGNNPLHEWGKGLSDQALGAGKAPATLQAIFYLFVGRYEMTHVWNIWMILIMTLMAPHFFASLRPRISSFGIVLGTLLLALNPVLMGQAFTSCPDAFFVAGIQSLIMVGALGLLKGQEEGWGGLALTYIFTFILLANTSVWGIFALLALTLTYILWALGVVRGKEGLLITLGLLVTVVLAYGFFGANPFMHNISREGAMLAPMSLQALEGALPAILQGHNPLVKLFLSLMSQPASDPNAGGLPEAIYFFALADPQAYLHPDPRLRGFGILSPLIIVGWLFALALTLWPTRETPVQKKMTLMVVGQVLLMTLVTPGAWWAKLVGFFWMVVVVVVMDHKDQGLIRGLIANLMVILILVNGFHYGAHAWPEQRDLAVQIEDYTHRLEEEAIPNDQDAQRFNAEHAAMPAWATLKRKGEEAYFQAASLPEIEDFVRRTFADGALWEVQKNLVKSTQTGGTP